jgi:hypothetical protein
VNLIGSSGGQGAGEPRSPSGEIAKRKHVRQGKDELDHADFVGERRDGHGVPHAEALEFSG